MTRYLPLIVAGLAFATPAVADQEFPAVLAGHAVLPAASFIDAPADAPEDLKTSGKYTTGRKVTAPGSVMGLSANRPTGMGVPFKGQPLQGHSGIKAMPDGSFWVITDNGMGSKYNSAELDALSQPPQDRLGDRARSSVRRPCSCTIRTRRCRSASSMRTRTKRYLTGADFDTEGFQLIGDNFWIGDEFGPYIIKADKSGKVLGVFETMADGKPVRSPDHYAIQSPGAPGQSYGANVNLRRSKGYEGFASSKDGKFIYALLEGPLWNAEAGAWEKIGGKEAARILEFDVAAEKFTGRFWHYVFEQDGHAIGDFNMIDGTTGLIIERDNGEGTADKACPAGQRGETCFPISRSSSASTRSNSATPMPARACARSAIST